MSESLEPMRLVSSAVQHVATSLMSGATAHTVKPSLVAPHFESGLRSRRRLPLALSALVAGSAALGLVGAVFVSRLGVHEAPVMHIVSGSPTLKTSSDGDRVRWHTSKNKIYFDRSLEALDKHAEDTVKIGFGTWLGSGAQLPSLDFDSTKDAKFGQVPNGKSEIMYGPIALAGHENDLALTVTFSDAKTGEVVESDMIFNSRYSYGVLTNPKNGTESEDDASCEKKYDLQSVATHEAGHFFGLGEDFEAKTATMYYTTGRCETNKRVLQGSDETTMSALYLSADVRAAADDPSSSTAKGCGGAHIGQGQTNGAVPSASLLGLLGFVAWRRRRRES